jgi:prepilin-type processing-associated H-X9-DG protein
MPPGCLIPGRVLSDAGKSFKDQQNGSHTIGDDGSTPWQMIGWAAFLLPHMEATQAYKMIDFTRGTYLPINVYQGSEGSGDEVNANASVSAPPVFRCPSASSPTGDLKEPTGGFTVKDYAAGGTANVLMKESDPTNVDSWWRGTFPDRYFRNFDEWGTQHNRVNGLFHRASGYNFSEITDGTSNTLAFLESHAYRPEITDEIVNPFLWVNHAGEGLIMTDGNHLDNDMYFINHNTGGPWNACRIPWSTHPGGVNVVLADGSTHFIPQSIAHHIYREMISRNDGKPPAEF